MPACLSLRPVPYDRWVASQANACTPLSPSPACAYTDWDAIVKLSDGFNGADLRNVCTEAGLYAIRAERDYCLEEDFMKAARKLGDSKRMESKMDYSQV